MHSDGMTGPQEEIGYGQKPPSGSALAVYTVHAARRRLDEECD